MPIDRRIAQLSFKEHWVRDNLVARDKKLQDILEFYEEKCDDREETKYQTGMRGADDGLNSRNYRPKMIVYIPSGGGKSTLARRFPWLYSDPDYVGELLPHIDFTNKEKVARLSQKFWDKRNQDIIEIYRNYPPTQPILLSWGTETVPPEWRREAKEIAVMTKPTGIRANDMNRITMLTDPDLQNSIFFERQGTTEHLHAIIHGFFSRPGTGPQILRPLQELFPLYYAVAQKLGQGQAPSGYDYEILIEQQDKVDEAAIAGLFSMEAYKYVLDMAYAGQKHDLYYKLVDQQQPLLLEDNVEIVKPKDRMLTIGLLHGLHVYDHNTVLRSSNGLKTMRDHEYRTHSPVELQTVASVEKPLYLLANATLSFYLMGSHLPTTDSYAAENLRLFRVDNADKVPAGSLIVPSFYSVYYYYRKSGIGARMAKRIALVKTAIPANHTGAPVLKLGMNTETGYKGIPKYRPYARATRAWKKQMDGSSAYEQSIADAQTPRRARRTAELKVERALDGVKLRRWQLRTTVQDSIANSLHMLEAHLTEQETSEEDVRIITSLWPIGDPTLKARTRVDADMLLPILQMYFNTYGGTALHNILWHTGGFGGQGFAGLVLYALSGQKNNTLLQAILLEGWCSAGLKYYVDKTKAMHNIARRTQELPRLMLNLQDHEGTHLHGVSFSTTDLLYFATLCGRIQDELLGNDGFVEKRLPVPKPHHLVTIDTDIVQQTREWDKHADEVFQQITSASRSALGRRSHLTPTEFHANFIQIAPPGSVNQLRDYAFKWLDVKKDVTKRLLLDSLPTSFLWECMDEFPPELFTNAQIKTETAGRLRQIVPGPDVQWLIESTVMFTVEKALYSMSPEFTLETTGMRVLSDIEERRLRTILKNVTVASDYADFNFLHLIPEMQKWWASIRKGAEELSGPGEWKDVNYPGHVVKCCDWLIASLDKMYVREVGGDGRFYRVKRGLWSGWRTTSTINNTFNYMYAHVIRKDIVRVLGYDPVSKFRLNGDDGDIMMKSIGAGLLYLRHLALAELDVQAEKQLVSRMVNEYLRIYAEDGKQYGSVCRTISSFVSSDLQSPVIDKGLNYVKGTSAAISTLIRRGFDPANAEKLRDIILLKLASVKTQLPNGESYQAQLTNSEYLFVPESQGGFGCTRYASLQYYDSPQGKNWPVERPKYSHADAPHYGVQAMMKVVGAQFVRSGLDTSVLNAVRDEAISIVTSRFTGEFQNTVSNYKRLLDAEHIDMLNKLPLPSITGQPKTKEPAMAKLVVERSLERVLNMSPNAMVTIDFTPLDTAVARQLSRVLGLASITPNIAKDLRDATTGQRMGIRAIAEKMQMALPQTYQLDSTYPPQLVEAYFSNSFELKRGTFDTLPAELQPVLDIVHAEVLRNCWVTQASTGGVIQQYNNLIDWANHYFTQIYISKYASRYQF